MSTIITEVQAYDIRFPTSKSLDGSDAMNPDPDYSATYVILKTNHPQNLEGHGLTFTIGRGNELCVAAVKALAYLVKNVSLETIKGDMGRFWKMMTGDSQLRWLGPEKGVIHLATAAIVNAVWDLYAKSEKMPVWQLLVEMSPEELVSCIDFSYIRDAITPEEAIKMLESQADTKQDRIDYLEKYGYPAYTTSAGWLGYSDDKIRNLCRQSLSEGWNHIKMKVGNDHEEDKRRAAIIREEIGAGTKLMMDANQKWGVDEAIEKINELSKFDLWWFEEPTSPDDILGHAKIAREIYPLRVATGEHCHNRIMFKQFMQAKAMDICQLDSARLGGINEILAVILMAAKFNIPVCPHAGGVGLCEYVQHLSIFDYVAVSGSLENRILEYVDHLHEHFIHPVRVDKGHYRLPVAPGYSIEMFPDTITDYSFSQGRIWKNMI